MATHEKLEQISNEFKDLPLEAKPKRGRRTRLALEKNSIYYHKVLLKFELFLCNIFLKSSIYKSIFRS